MNTLPAARISSAISQGFSIEIIRCSGAYSFTKPIMSSVEFSTIRRLWDNEFDTEPVRDNCVASLSTSLRTAYAILSVVHTNIA